MAAAKRNITIEQGATYRYSLIWKDSDGVPVDLSGYIARMQVRKMFTSDDTLLDLSSANGDIVLGGVLGTIEIEASAADTALITDKVGVYDVELESSSGVVTRIIEGSVTIKPEVTR
jgi:hypothetical protein